MQEFHVIKNHRGNYFRGKQLGWTPFFTEALLITDLDILPDIICWDNNFMQLEKWSIKNLGGGKSILQLTSSETKWTNHENTR